jgi:D-3-phosphoglycerate dehydrogenase
MIGADAEILVLTRERTSITEPLLQRLPSLKLISQTGKISNHLDLALCSRYGVAVAEGVGSPVAPAELTWALIMNTLRKIPQAIAGMQQGRWQVNIGSAIKGKTIGIWGYGKIGQRIASYAKAFEANVMVWGSESSRAKAAADGFLPAESKAIFFATADVVTLHLRLNSATAGIVKEQDLRSMKNGACFINTARAELVEPGALLKVLQERPELLAGLDVYEKEPILDADFPLLHLDNVVCTPHLGYVERNSYELYFGKAFENVLSFLNGNPVNIANPEVLIK